MNEIIKGMGFHHIALKASDFERSLEFYKALGLKERVGWGEGENRAVMLDLGDGGCIELFAGGNGGERIDQRYLHLALRADDIEAAYNTAIGAGAVTKYAPYIASPDGAVPPIKMQVAFVYGPDGETIEFFKEIQ